MFKIVQIHVPPNGTTFNGVLSICLPSSASLHLRIGPHLVLSKKLASLFRLRTITIIAMKITGIPYIGETTIPLPLLISTLLSEKDPFDLLPRNPSEAELVPYWEAANFSCRFEVMAVVLAYGFGVLDEGTEEASSDCPFGLVPFFAV